MGYNTWCWMYFGHVVSPLCWYYSHKVHNCSQSSRLLALCYIHSATSIPKWSLEHHLCYKCFVAYSLLWNTSHHLLRENGSSETHGIMYHRNSDFYVSNCTMSAIYVWCFRHITCVQHVYYTWFCYTSIWIYLDTYKTYKAIYLW